MSDYKLTAAILAGAPPGSGDTTPLLTELMERTLFQYLLKQIVKAGIDRIVICTTQPIADMLIEKFGRKYHNAELIYSCEATPMGTAGALVVAREYFDTDEILVLNGDAFIASNLKRFIEWYQESSRVEAGMLLADVEDAEKFGRVRFYDDNMIYHFEEKGKYHGPGLVNAGIYILKTAILDTLPEDAPSSLESDLFPKLVQERRIYCLPTVGKFIDPDALNAEWNLRNYQQKEISRK